MVCDRGQVVGTDIGDLPSFQDAIGSDRLVHGEPGPIRAVRDAQARAILPYRQRYAGTDGQPGGTMSALFDPDWQESYVNSVSWPQYAVVTTVHSSGRIIARAPMDLGHVIGADIPERLCYTLSVSSPGRGTAPCLDGVLRTYAFLPPQVMASGLMLSVAVDSVEALRPIEPHRFCHHPSRNASGTGVGLRAIGKSGRNTVLNISLID